MKQQLNLNAKITAKTKIILTAIILFVFLLVLSFITIKKRIHDAKIDLLIAPASSTIILDGKEYKNGKHDLSSGKHTIELSKDGFESQKEEIEIKSGETYIYYNYLQEPNGSMEWYKNHEEDSLLLETIIPALSDKHLKTLQEKYPLIKNLPINENSYSKNYSTLTKYSISYQISDSGDEVTILITYFTENSKNTALERIKTLGYNPDDYTIIYTDQTKQSTGWSKTE